MGQGHEAGPAAPGQRGRGRRVRAAVGAFVLLTLLFSAQGAAQATRAHRIVCRAMTNGSSEVFPFTAFRATVSRCTGHTGGSGALVVDVASSPAVATISWADGRTTVFTWAFSTVTGTSGCPRVQGVEKGNVAGTVTSDTTGSATPGAAVTSRWCEESNGGVFVLARSSPLKI